MLILLKNDFTRLEQKYQEAISQHQHYDGKGDKQIRLLEEEIVYLKKNFEIEIGILKDESDILRKELLGGGRRSSFTPNSKLRNTNYCSPIRALGINDLNEATNDKNLSPFTGVHSAMKQNKDRIIEQQNKENIALRLQIEEIINSQNKIHNSHEVEAIRRNILSELGELLYQLKSQLLKVKSSG
jgi:hypothetical protein